MNATQAASDYAERSAYAKSRLGILRLALSGAATAAIIFILCWLGTFIPFSSPTHAYIGLFTPAAMNSVEALVEGSTWSLLFGGFSAAIFAAVYNMFAGLDPQ